MEKRITLIALMCLLISSQAVGIEFVSRLHPTDSGPWTAVFSIDSDSGTVTEILRSSSTVVSHGIATAPDGRIYIGVQDYVGEYGTPEHTAFIQIIPFAAVRNESGEIEYTMEDPIFEHSYPAGEYETEPIHQISALATKNIGHGIYRVYFSTSSGAGADGQIYYVDNTGTAQPYYTVRLSDLLTPSCEGLGGFWAGDFVFDENNNLYLSSGNHVPSTLYRVSGAVADTVSGEPVWLHLRESGSMIGLDFDSPGSLYFVDREKNIHMLDLETFTEETIFTAADIHDIFSIALLRRPVTFSRPVLPGKDRFMAKRHLIPDLRIASAIPGELALKERGLSADVPLRIVIANTGNHIESVPFKIGAMATLTAKREPFVIPFSVYGAKDKQFFWREKLNANENLAIAGMVRIKSPDGRPLIGRKITITVQVDSCAGEPKMPQYCRVQEFDELNNTIQLKMNLPDPAAKKK